MVRPLTRLILLVLLLLPAPAWTEEGSVLLLRNVTLVDPAAAEDKSVSLLIRDGLLEAVSEETIPREEGSEVIDADGGFVLGRLELGEAANFMILSADPREDFEVMLDTRVYAVFAMHDGAVRRDRLRRIRPEEEPERPSRWLAYTPPPMVVPLSYRDPGKWNRWESRWVSGIFTAGLFLDRMNYLDQDAGSESVYGDLSLLDGGEIRGFRFGVVGTINFERPWVYTIFGATNAFDKGFEIENQDDFAWFDWRLDIPFLRNSVMSIGKQKEPISGERVQSMLFNHMQERSAVSDAMLPSRNVGIVWNGSNPEHYTSWGVGVFNDWLDADQDFDDSATQAIGRVTWAPLRSADDSNLLHLGLGYRWSDAKEGFRYRTEPEFNRSVNFVDTAFGQEQDILPAEELRTWTGELSWRRGPWWLASEYTRSEVDNPALGDPSFEGYWVGLSWILTGEMRAYNPSSGVFGGVPVSRSVYQRGKGAWELTTRWSQLDLEDGAVTGGELDIASLGLTWWLTPFFGVNANYRYIWNTREGTENETQGLNARLMLILE
jgi:phosphate-selective porin OprO/OprP